MRAIIGGGLLLVLGACSATAERSAAPPAPPAGASRIASANIPPVLAARSVELPGAKGPVSLDLIAYDRAHGRVWVPVGDTGSVDVFDIGSSAFKRVDGFETTQREMRGEMRTMGPSSATIGDGVAYVGNRATSEVCAIDAQSLQRGNCLKLATPADFVTYVAATKEVWVTTPRDGSLTLLDASTPAALKSKLVIKMPGSPEGSAVDADHKLFFTNLEDTNQTLVVDIESHAITATWSSGCSVAPHGIAVDPARGLVIVACSDGLRILDAAHDGALLGKLDAGDGVDDIFYDAAKRLVYVAAANAKRLTIASIGDNGEATVIATAATAERARNAVADTDGNTFIADAATARLLIFAAPK